MLVAPSAFAAFQQHFFHAGLIHVGHDFAGLVIPDHGSHRNLDDQVLPVFAVAEVRGAVSAVKILPRSAFELDCERSDLPNARRRYALESAVELLAVEEPNQERKRVANYEIDHNGIVELFDFSQKRVR